jgi:hypothetical protein
MGLVVSLLSFAMATTLALGAILLLLLATRFLVREMLVAVLLLYSGELISMLLTTLAFTHLLSLIPHNYLIMGIIEVKVGDVF